MKTILAISLLVTVGRFFVPGHGLTWAGTYEAFAHLWVGYLICQCAGCAFASHWDWRPIEPSIAWHRFWSFLALLTVMCAVEIVMFATRKV